MPSHTQIRSLVLGLRQEVIWEKITNYNRIRKLRLAHLFRYLFSLPLFFSSFFLSLPLLRIRSLSTCPAFSFFYYCPFSSSCCLRRGRVRRNARGNSRQFSPWCIKIFKIFTLVSVTATVVTTRNHPNSSSCNCG